MKNTRNRSLSDFFRKLGTMLGSGIPFADALDTFENDPLPEPYQNLPQELADGLRHGYGFTVLLKRQKNLFHKKLLKAVKKGEKNGTLDVALIQIADGIDNSTMEVTPPPGGEVTPPSGENVTDLADDDNVDENTLSSTLFNKHLLQALRKEASDIHIEGTGNGGRVRFRLDGQLRTVAEVSADEHREIIATAKKVCCCDPAEHILPQDGSARLSFPDGKRHSLRMAFLPTASGESCTVRILKTFHDHDIRRIEHIITSKDTLEKVQQQTQKSHGLFITSGPCGSGKTTTFYSLLKERDSSREKIISIEDPVELLIEGVNQVAVNMKFGITFPAALRSALRNDPDVVCAGEIRNVETAEILVQTALSGHMVYTSLHGRDAVSSLLRLINIGIEPTRLSDCLRGILGQQLVRKLCDNCKEPDTTHYNSLPQEATIYKAKGCDQCNNGYRGRVAIHEFLVIKKYLSRALVETPDYNTLYTAAVKDGLKTLSVQGLEAVTQGLTSVQELRRLLSEHDLENTLELEVP